MYRLGAVSLGDFSRRVLAGVLVVVAFSGVVRQCKGRGSCGENEADCDHDCHQFVT